jgi:multiple sugar transport system substrate-binding protein
MWGTGEPQETNLLKGTIIPAYQKLHPNVTIDLQSFPTAVLDTKLWVSIGNGTAADVMSMNGTSLPIMYPRNVLAPAEDQNFDGGVQAVIGSYISGTLKPLINNGKLYGLPRVMYGYSLAMNNRLFAAAGLDPIKDAPKTWDDIARLSKLLTKIDSNGRLSQKGFDFRWNAGPHWLTDYFVDLEYQLGGQVFDSNGKAAFNDANGVKVMETIQAVDSASSAYTQVSHNSSGSPFQDFASEQDAMALGGPNMGAFVESLNPKMVGNYTWTQGPQINPAKPVQFLLNFNWVVNGRSSPDAIRVGWDFVAFAMSDANRWFAATKLLTPKIDWYKQSPGKDTPGINVFVHDLSITRAAPATQYYAQFQQIIADAMQKVVQAHAPIQATLDAAAQQYNLAVSQG